MKLHLKISRSKSSSPLSSPITPSPTTDALPLSLNSPKPPSKSEKGKSLLLRLPSLSRTRSRGSKSETSFEASPKPPFSPLGQSSSSNMRPAPTSASPSHEQEPLIEQIKRVFEKFDSNGDGKVSADELQCVLKALGDNITKKEAELMVAEADRDKDGYIDLQEFINLNTRTNNGVDGIASTSKSGTPTDELAAAFNMFDLDKNGCITPDELHCVLGNLGNYTSTLEDCRRMICNIDSKGCGYVDFDDFKVMMTSNNAIIMT